MKQFIQNNFALYAVGSMTVSLVVGYLGLSYIQDKHKQQPAIRTSMNEEQKGTRIKGREEIRLEAMVENALKSSWKENLDNAFHAHERFMLPGRNHGQDPVFLQKIDQRSDELMKKQQKKKHKRQRRKKEEETTMDEDYDKDDPFRDSQKDRIQFWK